MKNSLTYLDTILAAITLIVTLVLVKGVRNWLVSSTKKLTKLVIHVSSLEKTHFLLLIIFQFGVGIAFVYFHVLSTFTAILITITFILTTIVFVTSLNRLRSLMGEFQAHLDEANIRRVELERNVRVQAILDRWSECLDRVSKDLSLTAVESLIRAAVVYDLAGNIIILKITRLLYPTYEVLRENIPDVEAIVEEVYQQKYTLKFIVLD